jgi:hypothetical protein
MLAEVPTVHETQEGVRHALDPIENVLPELDATCAAPGGKLALETVSPPC